MTIKSLSIIPFVSILCIADVAYGDGNVDALFVSPAPLGTQIREWSSFISTSKGTFEYKISSGEMKPSIDTPFGVADVYTTTQNVSGSDISIQTQVIQLESDKSVLFVQHEYSFNTPTMVKNYTWFSADLANSTGGKMFYGSAADTFYMSDYFALPVTNGYKKSGSMLKGGTPLNYVWNAEGGVAIGVLSDELGSYQLPLSVNNETPHISATYRPKNSLKQQTRFNAGDVVLSDWVMINYHQGDYFQPLRRLSLAQGLISGRKIVDAPIADSAKAPYWKTWGLDPNLDGKFTKRQIENDIVPLLQSVGIEWILLDYGWFETEQIWHYNDNIFSSDNDLKNFISRLKKRGMHVGLWYQPLQTDVDNDDVLDNDDLMEALVLNENGELYIDDDDLALLDPSHQVTNSTILKDIKRMKSWGVEMLYLDSQEVQLSSPPNYANEDPLSSHRALPGMYRMIQNFATANNMIVETCPDGRSQTLSNLPLDMVNPGDPRDDRQVRSDFKSLKALSGDRSVVGIYVDNFDDNPVSGSFMNVIGLGAKLETLFNVESFHERKDEWESWMKFYFEEDLVSGQYLDLYDIGFDYPEGHAVKTENAMYYTFFTHYDGLQACLDASCNDGNLISSNSHALVEPAKSEIYKGSIQLKGLSANRAYSITQYPGTASIQRTSNSDGRISLVDVTFNKEIMYIVKKVKSD